jgi:cardiolipin synthase A/B
MGHARGSNLLRRRRLRVHIKQALLVVAVVAALGVFIMVAGPAPPSVERLPTLAVRDTAFAGTLEAHLGAPVIGGNRVELLLNGDAIFPALLAAIRGARTSIDYAQYFWADGVVAREMVEALAERARAGVRVNVLLDGVGTLHMPGDQVETLRRSGCHVEWFRPLARFSVRRHNNRNHRRILVVDGRLGITGGSGVSDKWTGNGRRDDHWRDTDVRIEGPAVAWLQAAFVENWRVATGELLGGVDYLAAPRAPAGDVRVQVVRSSPAGGSYGAYTMILLAFAAARQSILMTNPYFVLDDRMTDTLIAAAQRGVRVVALTPGKIDHALVRSASRHDFGRLLKGGVQIYEYQAALLHAKTLVVDGAWSSVGSTNLDNRSFALNDELNLAVYDAGVAGRLAEVFEADLQRSRRVEYADWAHRGLTTRLQELVVLPVRDLL